MISPLRQVEDLLGIEPPVIHLHSGSVIIGRKDIARPICGKPCHINHVVSIKRVYRVTCKKCLIDALAKDLIHPADLPIAWEIRSR